MSENLAGSGESYPEPNEYQKQLYAIDFIRIEALDIIDALNKPEINVQSGDVVLSLNDTLYQIETLALTKRLEFLVETTLDIASHELSESVIDLNDSSWAIRFQELVNEIVREEVLYRFGNKFTDSINQGSAEATAIWLELLIPEEIEGVDERDVHFFPWRRDSLELTGHTITTLEDGTAEVQYHTRISNIVLVDSYTPGKFSLPSRSLRRLN